MKASCSLCLKSEAVLECEEDAARLCGACDELVHGANRLSNRHTRWPLCSLCGHFKATRGDHLADEQDGVSIKYACEACSAQLPKGSGPDAMLLAPLPPPQLKTSSPQPGGKRTAAQHGAAQQRSHRHSCATAAVHHALAPSEPRGRAPASSNHARHKRPQGGAHHNASQVPRSHRSQQGRSSLEVPGNSHLMELSADGDVQDPPQGMPEQPVQSRRLSHADQESAQLDALPPGNHSASNQGVRTSQEFAAGRLWVGASSSDAMTLADDERTLLDPSRQPALRHHLASDQRFVSSMLAPSINYSRSFDELQHANASECKPHASAAPLSGTGGTDAVGQAHTGTGQPVSFGVLGQDDPELLDHLFSSWTQETSNTPGLFGQGGMEDLWPMELDDPAGSNLMCMDMQAAGPAGLLRPDSLPHTQTHMSQGDDLDMPFYQPDHHGNSSRLTRNGSNPGGIGNAVRVTASSAVGLPSTSAEGAGIVTADYMHTMAVSGVHVGHASGLPAANIQQQHSTFLPPSAEASQAAAEPQPTIFSMPCSHHQPGKHQATPNLGTQPAPAPRQSAFSPQQQQPGLQARQVTDAQAAAPAPATTGAPNKSELEMAHAAEPPSTAFFPATGAGACQSGLSLGSMGTAAMQSGSQLQAQSIHHSLLCAPSPAPSNAMQPGAWSDIALSLASGSMPAVHASMLSSLQQLLQPLTKAAEGNAAPADPAGQGAHRQATPQPQAMQLPGNGMMHSIPASTMQPDNAIAAAMAAAAATYARPPAGLLLPPVPLPLPPGVALDQLDAQQQQHVAMQHMLLLQQRHALLLAMSSGRGSMPDGLLPGVLPGAAMHFAALAAAAAAAQQPGPSSSLRATDMGPPHRQQQQQQQQAAADKAAATSEPPGRQQMLDTSQGALQPQGSWPNSHLPSEQQQQQPSHFIPPSLTHLQSTYPMGLPPTGNGAGGLPDYLSNTNPSGLPMASPFSMGMGMLGQGAIPGMGSLPVLPGLLGSVYSKPAGMDLPPHLLHMMHPQLAMLAMLNQQQLGKPAGAMMPWDVPLQQHASQAMSQEARSTQSIKQQPRNTQPTSSNSQKQHKWSSGDVRTAEKASLQSSKHAGDMSMGHPPARTPQVVHQDAAGGSAGHGPMATPAAGPGSARHTMSGSLSGGNKQPVNTTAHAQQLQQQHQHQHASTAGLMLPPMGMGLPPLPSGLAFNPYLMYGAAAASGLPPERLQQLMTPWMLSAAAAGGGGAIPPGLLPPGFPLGPFLPPASQMGAAAHTAPTVCSVRPSGSGEAQGFAAGSMQMRMTGTQPAMSQMSLPAGMAQPRAGSEVRHRGASSTGAALSMGPMSLGMMGGAAPALQPDSVWGHDQRYSERGQALTRYRQKRKLRHFEKTIRYASRQVRAHKRPRVKGRFIKAPTGGIVEGDGFGYAAPGLGGLTRTPSMLAVVGDELAEVEEGDGEGGDMLLDDAMPHPECSEQHSGHDAGAMSSTDADADAELSEEERHNRPMVHSPALPGLHARGSALLPAAAAPVTAISTLRRNSANDEGVGLALGHMPSVGAPAPAELQGEQPPRQHTVSNSMTSRASMGSVHQEVGKGISRPKHPAGTPALGMATGQALTASALLRGTPSAGAGEAVDEQGQGAGQEGSVWGPGLAAAAYVGGCSGPRMDSVGQVVPAAVMFCMPAGGQQHTVTKQPSKGGMRIKLLDESSSSSSQNKHAAMAHTPPKGGRLGATPGHGLTQPITLLAPGGNGARRHGSGSSGGRSSGQRGGGGVADSQGCNAPPVLRASTGALVALPGPAAPAHAEIQGEQPLHIAAPAVSESAENTPPALEADMDEHQVVGPCRPAATIPSIASNGVGQHASGALHPAHTHPQHSSGHAGGAAAVARPSGEHGLGMQHSQSTRGRGRGSSTGAHPHALSQGGAGEVGALLQCASLGTAVGSHHLTGSCGGAPGTHTAATSCGAVCADDEVDPDGNFCDSVAPEVSGASNTLPSMEASTLCPDGMEAAGRPSRDAPSTVGTVMQGSKRSKRSAGNTMPPEGADPGHLGHT